jgi:hypothetical protein
MEKQNFNEWINNIANKNGYIELADNTVIIEDAGYWCLFKYPDRECWEFIFYSEILN